MSVLEERLQHVPGQVRANHRACCHAASRFAGLVLPQPLACCWRLMLPAAMLHCCLVPAALQGTWPFFLPACMNPTLPCKQPRPRCCCQGPVEPCEEIRLQLLVLLGNIVSTAGPAIGAYAAEAVMMAEAGFQDPFYEVNVQACSVVATLNGALPVPAPPACSIPHYAAVQQKAMFA